MKHICYFLHLNASECSHCLTSQLCQSSYFPAHCFDYLWLHMKKWCIKTLVDACRCLQNEEHASSNYCRRRLSNKTSLDVAHNLQHVLASFDVALSVSERCFQLGTLCSLWNWRSRGHQGQQMSTDCPQIMLLQSWMNSVVQSKSLRNFAQGFDHKLRAVASHSIVKCLRYPQVNKIKRD
jgi:hypothetical protein